MSDLPVVAISVGDTNGIGTEIILKSFESKELFKICTPVLYCDYDFVEKLQKIYKTKVNLFKVIIISIREVFPDPLSPYIPMQSFLLI